MSSIGFFEALEKCAAEIAAAAPPVPVPATTRRMRRVRAEQLGEVARVIETGEYVARFRSPTDWLIRTTGESAGACKQTVTLARRLSSMPIVAAAFAEGELPESALRLLVEAWNDDVAEVFARDEELLTEWALRFPNSDFKMLLDTWRMRADPTLDERGQRERFDRRSLHLSSLLDGMGRLDGLLDREGTALVTEAIRALSQPCVADDRTPAQRRADALVTMAKVTLANLQPQTGRKRRTPKVIATISWADLQSGRGGGSLDTGAGRTLVSAETIRRLACDAGIHRYVTGPDDSPINFGRSRRVVSDAQFDRLVIRDHGCRLGVGCSIPASACEAHHVIHWPDGGNTDDDELILTCWYHHRQAHEEHWSIRPLGAGRFEVTRPDGDRVTIRPPLVGLTLPEPRLPV